MRIDPKGTIAGYPSLQVRRALKRLHFERWWNTARLEVAAALPPGDGRAFAKALVAAGLAEAVGKGVWAITQAGQTLSSATAARRVTRATAEKALAEFLGRVDHVNRNKGFLGKVVTVVLFGSMLQPEVDRPSDVDLAVEIAPKEVDPEKARVINDRHAQMLESLGSSLPWIPEAPVLLALRSLSLFERAESRDITGGPQGRGRVRPSGTAPDTVCRWCLEAGRAAPGQGGPPRNVVCHRPLLLMGLARAAAILR